MKTGDELKEVVYGYWARRFLCARQDFLHPGTLFIQEEDLAGKGTLYLYHIDQMRVLRIAPSLAEQMGMPDGSDRESASLTVDEIQSFLGEGCRLEVESTLLDCYLDAGDFEPFPAVDGFVTRRLDPETDNVFLLDLYGACTEEDLDEAAIDVDEPDPVIFGIFDEGRLVAYASHRYWDDVIADIGVLIHPDYRSRGLGKAVVSELCLWCIRNDVVPMYRAFDYHHHSRRLARALGFREMVRVETLKLHEGCA
jgi:GNAT superfamily N-acetyltransferase